MIQILDLRFEIRFLRNTLKNFVTDKSDITDLFGLVVVFVVGLARLHVTRIIRKRTKILARMPKRESYTRTIAI